MFYIIKLIVIFDALICRYNILCITQTNQEKISIHVKLITNLESKKNRFLL